MDGKILGVQKLERATGKAQAEASFEMLQLWQLEDKVRALVFDTTASNSGWKNGAAKILEELLEGKFSTMLVVIMFMNLLWVPCGNVFSEKQLLARKILFSTNLKADGQALTKLKHSKY